MRNDNFHSTKKRFRITRSPLALVGTIFLFVFLLRAAWSVHEKSLVSGARLSQARAELDKLQVRNLDLQAKVGYLSTDQGLEKELRTRYRAIKEGESVAVIVGEPESTTTTSASSTEPVGWWRKFVSWFGL